ncbi:MAG: mannose-1-phosphate guanylyltransferase/mannose-6-phosphate isomerase [Deltaproteobacteria bacterium]|nr:MAG: mannose-1-phosphate guanylyltransferase/mannose-6-phosphate isomerase [Deltaproteobacteria bacterium]
MIVPIILAGGSGTRLWPLSRELYPKQLIDIYNENTMLQNTLMRLVDLDELVTPVVVCNDAHRFMTAEQLQQIGIEPHSIILEPIGRNTAPAIALAAIKLLEKEEDPVMLVLPADHVIENIPHFHEKISQGNALAEQGFLITFGIVPSSPETGYGYIKKGKMIDSAIKACEIECFVEKPDQPHAQEYVASKEYCWNSGIFMFKTSVIIKELERYAPDMLNLCRQVIASGAQDLDFFRINRELFEKIDADSIDYAIMEKTDKGIMMSLDAGWNDLGSFDALWQTGDKDGERNVLKGDILTQDVKDSYIHSESRLVAAVGLEKFVIVETSDAVLVAPRDRVQDVKKIVLQLNAKKREESVTHRRVYRPWGNYETIDMSQRYQVKRITVKPGAKLSLQKHYHRAEHWTVVSGTAIVTRGDQEILLLENESTYISLGTVHRLENPGTIPLELIEVQSGSYLGEDDIVRFDDVYGRKEDTP